MTNNKLVEDLSSRAMKKYSSLIVEDIPKTIFLDGDEFKKYLLRNSERTFSEIEGAHGLYDPLTRTVVIDDQISDEEKSVILSHELLHGLAGKWILKKEGRDQFKAGLQINEAYYEITSLIKEVSNLEANEIFTDFLAAELNGATADFSTKRGEEKEQADAFMEHVHTNLEILEKLRISYFTKDQAIYWKSMSIVQQSLDVEIYEKLFCRYRVGS